jgi:hypothetical protein
MPKSIGTRTHNKRPTARPGQVLRGLGFIHPHQSLIQRIACDQYSKLQATARHPQRRTRPAIQQMKTEYREQKNWCTLSPHTQQRVGCEPTMPQFIEWVCTCACTSRGIRRGWPYSKPGGSGCPPTSPAKCNAQLPVEWRIHMKNATQLVPITLEDLKKRASFYDMARRLVDTVLLTYGWLKVPLPKHLSTMALAG